MPFRSAFNGWIALAPVLAYLVTMATSVLRSGSIVFGRTDLLVLVFVGLYGVALIWAAPVRVRLFRLLLVVYIFLFGLALAEAAAWMAVPSPLVDNYPWPVIQWTRPALQEVSPDRESVTFSVNRYGVRGRSVDPREADVSILCVGGSTTECLYNTDETSWPWQLEDQLAQRMGQQVFVGNAGRSGQVAANHSYLIRHYDGVDRFDCILVLCGINDVGALLRDDRDARLARVSTGTLFEWSRPHEADYRRLRLWRWMESALNIGTAVSPGLVFQDAKGDWLAEQRRKRETALRKRTYSHPPIDLERGLADYRQDLLGIVQAAAEKAIPVAMMTQPVLWRPDLPGPLSSLLWEHTDAGAYTPGALAETMAAYNQTMIDVCAETGTPCLDLADRLPKDETVFYDDCHFNDKGCQKVAAIVSQWLSKEVLRSSLPPVP